MGIILVAAVCGGAEAHLGAAYQITGHAIAKSFCFFAAGIAVIAAGTQEIAAVRGLVRHRRSPTAALASAGGIAIAGAPPFAVFVSEFAILKAGLAERPVCRPSALLALFVVVAFCAVMLHSTGWSSARLRRSRSSPPLRAACLASLAARGDPDDRASASMCRRPLQSLLAGAAAALGN